MQPTFFSSGGIVTSFNDGIGSFPKIHLLTESSYAFRYFDDYQLKMLRIGKTFLVFASLLGTGQLSCYVRSKIQFFLSIVEAEHIAIGNCCTQLLQMKQMLKDYDIEQGITSIHYDNSSVSNISKNLILHSQTKYIEIHHHFIRDLVEDKVIL